MLTFAGENLQVVAAKKIHIESFLHLAAQYPVLDVRSPCEYSHARIPGAYSFPLFTDDERKIVGTAYKQQNRESAIKIGLDFFGPRMKQVVEEAETIAKNHNSNPNYEEGNGSNHSKGHEQSSRIILVHCWRGGMRSEAIGWLLDLYGFKVFSLAGGYKIFRRWVLEKFQQPYSFSILGGYTGSAKTILLKELCKRGELVIDLEALANHKGSAFGDLGEDKQPSQEMFENELALQLALKGGMAISGQPGTADQAASENRNIWLEDESQRIGSINIPQSLWLTMRSSPLYFLDIPFEERLETLLAGYALFEKEKLASAILRINKRLGGLGTRTALTYLAEDNFRECFRILLSYYDKLYSKSLHNRTDLNSLLTRIKAIDTDSKANAERLLRMGIPLGT